MHTASSLDVLLSRLLLPAPGLHSVQRARCAGPALQRLLGLAMAALEQAGAGGFPDQQLQQPQQQQQQQHALGTDADLQIGGAFVRMVLVAPGAAEQLPADVQVGGRCEKQACAATLCNCVQGISAGVQGVCSRRRWLGMPEGVAHLVPVLSPQFRLLHKYFQLPTPYATLVSQAPDPPSSLQHPLPASDITAPLLTHIASSYPYLHSLT